MLLPYKEPACTHTEQKLLAFTSIILLALNQKKYLVTEGYRMPFKECRKGKFY